MAVKSTIYKAQLEISDIDRGYYASHSLTLAQHPSETDRRLMARLIAFILFAEERLEFGRGISTEEDPDLWCRNYSGDVELWIELGQPEESAIRKACGRSKHVAIINHSGNSADVWWSKNEVQLGRLKNLTVINLDANELEEASQLVQRTMKIQAMVQEGCCQLMDEKSSVRILPMVRMKPRE